MGVDVLKLYWRALMAETILITGAAGFLGSNFLHRWLCLFSADRMVMLDKLTHAADPKLQIFVKNHISHTLRHTIDANKIRNQLDWNAEESCETGLRKTVAWSLKT